MCTSGAVRSKTRNFENVIKFSFLLRNNILISTNMDRAWSVFDQWTLENNDVVKKYQRQEGGQDVLNQSHNQTQSLKWCLSEFHKLLRKIQGIPPQADHAELELAVVYNACVCLVAQSQFSEAELLFTKATDRVAHITGRGGDTSDLCVRWTTVFKSVENTALKPCVLYLFCLQWASWLATGQLNVIQDIQSEISSLCETLCGEVWDDWGITTKEKLSNIPMLMMNPRRLSELLQICTSIAQGAEKLSDGRSSEALSSLQTASTMPAPRALVAFTHLLSGFCLAHMSRPQMALQCYRKALETDPRCTCALYQSMLIYRQQGNTQAEIQALCLLHKTLMIPSASQPTLPDTRPLSPSLFLCSQSLTSLLSVPSALSVLHSTALKCVLHGRVSEGVEHYLDLLAALHSEDQNKILAEVHILPRLTELYLEAGAALLIDQRPADCMALCNEVISTTMELLPGNVVLEEQEEKSEPETRELSVHGDDKVAILFWTAAAYLLQGHCHKHRRDWKQAVTHYTRCINLLVKVCIKKKGSQPQIPTADVAVNLGTNLYILQRLKGLSLAGRGLSFTQMDRLKEALRDLQLSLHAFPDCVGSGLWCGEVLWRLGRRQEAAACWKKTWSISPQSFDDRVPVYLHELQNGASLDSSELRHRIQELGLA